MIAFNYEALWSKSKVFVDRAVRARDNGDNVEFHLWAAISLELLGKSALAYIHPALVADPSQFHSMLAACGHQRTKNVRSITARTVFERLHVVSDNFDERMRRACMLMADRRNAELHSGESPLHDLNPKIWVPQFWRAADVLLQEQKRALEDWIDVEEAARVRAILADADEVARQAVVGRIERRRAEFDARFPKGSAERANVAARAAASPLPARFYADAAAHEEVDCPACGMKGWLFGFERAEELLEEEHDPESGPIYLETVRVTYGVEEFRCPECGLVLEGRQEIELSDLPEEFEWEEQREAEYEPDYGNE